MDELPGNSKRAKMTPESMESSRDNEKNVQSVITNAAIRRKKPLGKRLNETFFGGNIQNVIPWVMAEVVMPAIKDTLADAASQTIERMLFGESRGGSRRPRSSFSGSPREFVSYNRFADAPKEDRREISRRSRSRHDFDEIVLATRVEAETVLNRLDDLIRRYEEATVADLYDLVEIRGDYTDDKWGWKSIQGARPVRIRDGYLLDLPKPEPLAR